MFKRKLMAVMVSVSVAMAAFTPMISVEAAGKQTMYVINETAGISSGYFKYTYNKNGLLSRAVAGSYKVNYTYNGMNLTKRVENDTQWKEKTVTTFEYDENDRLESSEEKLTSSSRTVESTSTYSYDKKDRIKKVVKKEQSSSVGNSTTTTKYTYNGQGLTSKIKGKGYTYQFEYDANGNESRFISDGVADIAQNVYDQNGCLTNVSWHDDAGNDTGEGAYTYIKIKVPAKYVNIVKAQQWELINDMSSPNVLH